MWCLSKGNPMSIHEDEAVKEKMMWNLIKADIAYNRMLFVFLYSVAFITVATNAIYGKLEEALATLAFFSVVVIGITAGIEELKTKRIRFFAGLPLSARHLGILRYIVFVAYWASLMILIWLSSLISQQGQLGLDYLWWILTRIGGMFIWIACMNLSQDSTFIYKARSLGYVLKWTVLLFGVFGGPFVYFVTNPRYQSDIIFFFVSNIFQNPTGAIALFLLSLGLMVLSVVVYEQRRSYTE
jgi:hypothetical protein